MPTKSTIPDEVANLDDEGLTNGVLALAALQGSLKPFVDQVRREVETRTAAACKAAKSSKIEWPTEYGVVRYYAQGQAPAVVDTEAFHDWVACVAPAAISVTFTVAYSDAPIVAARLVADGEDVDGDDPVLDGLRLADHDGEVRPDTPIEYSRQTVVSAPWQKALLDRARPGRKREKAVDVFDGIEVDAEGLVVDPKGGDNGDTVVVIAGVAMQPTAARLTVSADKDAKERLSAELESNAFRKVLPAITGGTVFVVDPADVIDPEPQGDAAALAEPVGPDPLADKWCSYCGSNDHNQPECPEYDEDSEPGLDDL